MRLVAVSLVLLVVGCGARPRLVQVTGTVKYKGQPLNAGSIWFHPVEGNSYQGEKPSCQLSLDGTFAMRTYPHGQGVPPGAYKVTLSPDLARRIHRPEYAEPAKTPLSVEVPDAGLANHSFEVK